MTDRARSGTKSGRKKTSHGAIAQLGERLPCTQEVVGSIPSGSTKSARTLLLTNEFFIKDIVVLSSLNSKEIASLVG